MLLSREQFLECAGLGTERVRLAGMPGEVLVRGLTLAERNALILRYQGEDGSLQMPMMALFQAETIAACLVDDDGRPLLQQDDVAMLVQKNAAMMAGLYEVIARLSGLSPSAVEDAQKNSAGPADVSSSG